MNNWGYIFHLWHWVVAFVGMLPQGPLAFQQWAPVATCSSLSPTTSQSLTPLAVCPSAARIQAFLKSTTFSLNPEQSWQGPATPPHMGALQEKEQLPHVKFEYVPYRKQVSLWPIDLPVAILMQLLFTLQKKNTPHGKNYSSSWVLHDHTEWGTSPVHYQGPFFRPQSGHNSTLAILIIGLRQL